MSGGLRGGGPAGFGTAMMQYDFGGPDNPVMALVTGVGISNIPGTAKAGRVLRLLGLAEIGP